MSALATPARIFPCPLAETKQQKTSKAIATMSRILLIIPCSLSTPPTAENFQLWCGAELIVETAASDVEDDRQEDQYSPNQHYVLDAEFARVHPAPDEAPETADQTNDSLKHACVLKHLNQDDDKADQTP
jgi:hypothetical protein